MANEISKINGYPLKDATARAQIMEADLLHKKELSRIGAEVRSNSMNISVERERINHMISLPEGKTTGDAELEDIRIDCHGYEWGTAGDAVRIITEQLESGGIKEKAISARSVEFVEHNANLFDSASNENRVGVYIGAEGFVEGQTTQNYAVTHPIYLEANKRYKIPHSSAMTDIYYAARVYRSGAIIQTLPTIAEGNYEVFTPSGSGFYAFNFIPKNKTVMVCEYDKYPDQYVIPDYAINAKYYGEKMIGKISIDNAAFVAKSINLFDRESQQIKTGAYINYKGYMEDQDSGKYAVTHPIYLEAGKKYKLPRSNHMGSNYKAANVDEDGNVITLVTVEVEDNYEVFTPSVSGFYAFNFTPENKTVMVCEYDKYPDQYVEYGYMLDERVGINKKQSSEAAYKTSPLYGKKIALNGDSICYGSVNGGGYGVIIAGRYNMRYQNIAKGGGTITAETYQSSSGAARHWVSRSIENMDADADYVVLEGGVNDAAIRATLGTISDGFNATLDDTTFYGAFESMIKQALIKYPGKKLCYIAVHKMTDRYRSESTENSYYHAAKECCRKWGIPFCDLNDSVPPFAYFDEGTNLYSLRESFTTSADGWHPNVAGYEAYYVPQIVSFLEKL